MASKPGTILWTDLTVPNAEQVRDFYSQVVGWKPAPVAMGDYEDFNMLPPGSETPSAGICHARGMNADMPPLWMVYFVVADIEPALTACQRLGGRLLAGPKGDPGGRFAVIQDPAGAVAALVETHGQA